MKDEKDLIQYKNGSKGKTPGQKKIPPGAWMFVLCYTVVWNISDMKDEKDLIQYKMDQRGKTCCQVEVSATSWSLVQRSPTECGVSQKRVIVKPRKMRQPRPPRGCRTIGKKINNK
jgi:hypothetical protein